MQKSSLFVQKCLTFNTEILTFRAEMPYFSYRNALLFVQKSLLFPNKRTLLVVFVGWLTRTTSQIKKFEKNDGLLSLLLLLLGVSCSQIYTNDSAAIFGRPFSDV